jgi:solute carrier family 25 (mitochondrial phosphate transporter), member 3
MFPSHDALTTIFALRHPLPGSKPKPQHASLASSIKHDPFPAWSAVDDVKNKSNASGKIELYSPQYYAACIVGGLLACVSTWLLFCALGEGNL